MPRVTDNFKKLGKTNDKYQVTVYLEPKEAEAVKAISLAQDLSLSSVIVGLMKESLTSEKYQTAIQAYHKFKNSLV